VVSATESAERDRLTIERGTPSRVLMQRAGQAAADEISRRHAERLRDGAIVFTGPGNNGGDGWVVAGSLARAGVRVTVVEVAQPKTPDAIAEKKAASDSPQQVEIVALDGASRISSARVVIDAVLGTGGGGEPRGTIAEAISIINQLRANGARVASLDVPSGLDATTGKHSACVVADTTLTFGGIKRGSLLARDCCGEIVVLDIGLDENLSKPTKDGASEGQSLPMLVDGAWVRAHVPPIRYDAHKGTRKHLAVIGGGKGMAGAAVLATRSALRSGIGMLRAFVARENKSDVLNAAPSALIAEWPNESDIAALISKWADAIVIGPGLGKSDESLRLVEMLLRSTTQPVVLDADALNVFDGDLARMAKLLGGRQSLITPHVAEFARLAGVQVPEVLKNSFDIGSEVSRTLGSTVLLKGSPTVIFAPNGERYVAARGTAALGTGGSGDLLAGIAGTLLAQMSDAPTAASCAAWIHGRAAELCGYVRGTTLEDVLYALPRAWNEPVEALLPPLLATLPAVAQ
jgi:hydroxyethylthiazole kinase-like uncharacterized protein yjeF